MFPYGPTGLARVPAGVGGLSRLPVRAQGELLSGIQVVSPKGLAQRVPKKYSLKNVDGQ